MKTLHYSIIITSIILITILIIPQYVYANTCSVKLTDYTTPQFFLLSDIVFAGTVQHIDNTTDHQWKVTFIIDKLWKGSVGQKPLIVMTNTLQGCGYFIASGEKYLVYTNGYPPNLNPISSKAYADAKSDIMLLDDPKFQSDEKIKEELYKKLVNAKDALSNLSGSKMSKIPISYVGVNDLNLTLDVGIADKKASIPSGAQEYKQKLEKIVGDVPIKVQYSDYVSALPEIISSHQKPLPSPLKQFKSGIATKDTKCNDGFLLTFKATNGSPACMKQNNAGLLVLHGWALTFQNYSLIYHMKSNSTAQIFVEYNSQYVSGPTSLNPRIYDGKTQYQTPPSKISATVNPDSVPGSTNSTVTYTITTNATTGIYWLSVDGCQFIPIAVNVDRSQITGSDLQFVMSGWRCPVSFWHYHVVDVSNIMVEYKKD